MMAMSFSHWLTFKFTSWQFKEKYIAIWQNLWWHSPGKCKIGDSDRFFLLDEFLSFSRSKMPTYGIIQNHTKTQVVGPWDIFIHRADSVEAVCRSDFRSSGTNSLDANKRGFPCRRCFPFGFKTRPEFQASFFSRWKLGRSCVLLLSRRRVPAEMTWCADNVFAGILHLVNNKKQVSYKNICSFPAT